MFLAVGEECLLNHGALPMAPTWPHIVVGPSLAMEDNATQKSFHYVAASHRDSGSPMWLSLAIGYLSKKSLLCLGWGVCVQGYAHVQEL